ncbi:MAG: hypothetical protein ACI4SX_01840 [Candidatus Fimenecus sp.]
MKTIEQFYNEIIASEELKEKLAAVSSAQKLDEFLKENEVDGTKEEFKEYVVEKAKTSGELTDEQLEAVAGGGVWDVVKSIIITLSFDAGCV